MRIFIKGKPIASIQHKAHNTYQLVDTVCTSNFSLSIVYILNQGKITTFPIGQKE